MKARILWIEGKRADSPPFVPVLRKKDYLVEVVSSGKDALERLLELDPDLVVINAASFRTNGKRICRSLREKVGNLPLIIITRSDQAINGDPCANVVLNLPFTARKLINRIISLIPGSGTELLQVGDLCLDTERNQVRCLDKEAQLTPRLSRLLHILMLHPGEVVKRGDLFKEAWKTEYTGDTRTLDVHVSWLREAIEVDPRRPRYLKTIRRVGYRLDV